MGLFSTEEDVTKTPQNDSLIGNLKGYLDTRIDLVRLELQQKAKGIFVRAAHGLTLAFIGLFFFLFLNLFLAFLLNYLLESPFWGFGIVAGFYLILLVVFIMGVDKKAFQALADKTLDNTIYTSDKRQA